MIGEKREEVVAEKQPSEIKEKVNNVGWFNAN
jgi:hypothetical protein